MSFSLISSASGVGTSKTATTSSIDTTGANLIAVSLSTYSSNRTLTDSKGNTWTPLTNKDGSNCHSQLFYCFNPTVGSGHTFTVSSAVPIYATICVQAWSGADTSPFDVENGAIAASGPTLQTGSVTPSQNNDLIVSGLCSYTGTGVHSIDSSFSVSNYKQFANGVNLGGGMGYLVQATAGAVNPMWSWTGTAQASATIATFKAAAVIAPSMAVAMHHLKMTRG